MAIKLIFFGTPQIAAFALKALIQDERFRVLGAVTEPEKRKGRGRAEAVHSPVFEVAQKHGVSTFTPQPAKKDDEVQRAISGLGADVYVVIAYGKIIPPAVFGAPEHGTVNVHFSLLPELRGPSPVQWALLEGKNKTGVTLMKIDEELDHGPVISQEEVAVSSDDTFVTLSEKLSIVGTDLLLRDLPKYVSGELTPRAQDHSRSTYSKMIQKEDGHIDWSRSAEEIYRKWRAFIVWPGIFTYAGNLRLNLKRVQHRMLHPESGKPAGTLYAEDQRLFVACGSGALEILEIQPEGKKPMSAEAFTNGHRNLVGTKLL